MSINSETSKTIFPCNGSAVDFDFDFKVFDEADLEVILYTIADGTETILTLGTDYSTSLLTETGGRITTVATYSSAYKLIARRKQDLVQGLDYTQNDTFSTLNLEQQLDKIVMMIQGLQEQVDRAVKFDASIIEAESVIDLPNVEATISTIDINGLTEKTAPVDDDVFIIEDSEADYQQKKVKKTKVLAINTLTEKTSLADNDLFLIEDSEAGNIRKKVKNSKISGFKVGAFTRDMTTASGDVSYTGVGFKPRAILFFGGVNLVFITTWGIDDSINHNSIYNYGYNTPGAFSTQPGYSLLLAEAAGKFQAALVKTFNADGFTLTWTTAGTLSAGTTNIYYLALR